MNKNDHKRHRSQKGLIDPNKTKTYLVYHETDLLTFLCEKITSQSKHNVRRIIANHQVAVGGAPVSLFAYKLYPEDEVTVSWTRIQKRERHDLPIIYEDDDIIAINKPSGLLSTASEREKGRTAYRLLTDYVTQKDRNSRIFVVHRLDEDTSGVLIFAKSFEVREALQNSWQDIVTNRAYYAIVEGEDIPEEGTLKDYLAQDSTFTVFVTRNKSKGKLAITKYKKMASRNGYSLLDVHLESGRKNQIRVQLGHIGHYVIGDDRYGEPSDPLHRLGLHAYELDFSNPLNGKKYEIKAPIPESFKRMFWRSDKEKKLLRKPAEGKRR
ncbi:MAG: RluA family pseudouridine synthase [Bacilli bacterium]|jgi:23S rRNA pseudouridine1911/1915/1917 synthase|nr:RluA family pseudouridine synthase [Bacilli bacterium]MCH4210153.1 RluA family pseudouridine synthase [Bacilli bacterium]MCH4228899.1 RluA family pseudouridine synthase [Bacilli bacterium]